MAQLVENCPRCGAQKMAFDLLSATVTDVVAGWHTHWEAFCVCGNCNRATIFHLSTLSFEHRSLGNMPGGLVSIKGSANQYVRVEGYVSLKDQNTTSAPDHLPVDILAAFNEGAKCMSVDCHNAAGTMFRLCVDMTSRSKLPDGEIDGLNARVRRDLGLRLPWLFDNHYLPEDLRDLSSCIKEDGNDGAHRGSLTKEDALDLLDFTEALLKRVYTEPERLRLAKERRDVRRMT